jgi:methionyl-tRNA formyltransferase
VRIVILSSFPLLDRHGYKKRFLVELLKKSYTTPSDVALIYGKSRWRDYLNEARSFGWKETAAKLQALRAPAKAPSAAASTPEGSLGDLARASGVRVAIVDALKSRSCLSFLRSFSPEVIVNLSGAFVPAEVLTASPNGVLSGHYGTLPLLRGTDVVRWGIYLNLPIEVSHMVLAPELDMGNVIGIRRVSVSRGDTFRDIYRKCQDVSAEGHLRALDAIHAGSVTRTPQNKDEGGLFYRMGEFLRVKVDQRLARLEYGHYE